MCRIICHCYTSVELGNEEIPVFMDTVEDLVDMKTWRLLEGKMALKRSEMAAIVVDPGRFFCVFGSCSGSDHLQDSFL